MNRRINNGTYCYQLFVGWCALLLYLGACSPLGAGLAALFGSFDPDHQLMVGGSQSGTRLVLHHSAGHALHRHGLTARALTLFAQPANAVNPDHILQLASPDTLQGKSRISVPEPSSNFVLQALAQAGFLSYADGTLTAPTTLLRSPNVVVPCLCLRSTALLI